MSAEFWIGFIPRKKFSEIKYRGLKHETLLRKKCPYSELFWSAFYPNFPAFGLNTERYNCEHLPIDYFKNRSSRPSSGVLRKMCSQNIQQIYRRTTMLKCNFNKVAFPENTPEGLLL